MKAPAQKLTLYTAVVLALLIVGVILYVQLAPQGQAAASGGLELEGQPALGQEDAPVQVAVFEDFKCPACAFFDENILPQLRREYVESGEARVYFLNYPFLGPDSTTAAIAGECAYQQDPDAFWDYKTYIFRSQGPESEEWATPERLAEIARTNVPQLDADALESCITEGRFEAAVEADRELGNRLDVQGTPTVFVNGEKVEDLSYEAVRSAVESALAQGGNQGG